MIVERRAYRLKPGAAPAFWALQRDWYWPPEIGDFFAHSLGHFETLSGGIEIVHFYAFADLGEWEAIYGRLYGRFPAGFFAGVRATLTAQRSDFFLPAPLPAHVPSRLGGALAGPAGYAAGRASDKLVMLETDIILRPGMLPYYWAAVENWRTAAPDRADFHIMGHYSSLVGQFHRVLEYRWFEDAARAADFVAAREHDVTHRQAFSDMADMIDTTGHRYLTPAPFAWLRSQFEPFDRTVFEARDPSQRVLPPWPPAPAAQP